MDKATALLALWAEGAPAPYALFEADVIIGGPQLVEQVADDRPPVILAGEPIPPDLAARVAAQVSPPPGPPIDVDVLVRDENGEPTFGEDGSPITELVTVTPPSREPALLSLLGVSLLPVPTCDMCGRETDRLTRIGSGTYCNTDTRTPDGADQAATCFALRMEQIEQVSP